MRKKDDMLRDKLLDISRRIAGTQGLEALSIRAIAQQAGVAAGTVYNYFASKDEILLVLTEEYWELTLSEMRSAITAEDFCGQLREIFEFLNRRIDQNARSLMNSLGNAQMAGQARMSAMQARLEAALVQRLEQDPRLRSDIWSESFTRARFARFIMGNMLMLLREQSPDISFFIAAVERIIY